MATYLIQGSKTNVWTKEIEANSEQEALEKHEVWWEETGYSYEHHNWKDGNTEWEVITEVKE